MKSLLFWPCENSKVIASMVLWIAASARAFIESLYLAGDEYTIADIVTFPWVRSYENQEVDIAEYANCSAPVPAPLG